jgi:hypothetical protein
MRVISGTGPGAFALFFASHKSSFKVPLDCSTMATHRVLGLIVERASHARKYPRCNEASPLSRGSESVSTVSGTSISLDRCYAYEPHPPVPVLLVCQLAPRSGVHVLEEFMLEAGATQGRD